MGDSKVFLPLMRVYRLTSLFGASAQGELYLELTVYKKVLNFVVMRLTFTSIQLHKKQ